MDKVDNVNVPRNIYSRPPRNNFNDLASSYFGSIVADTYIYKHIYIYIQLEL